MTYYMKGSLLICWSPIGDSHQKFGRQIFFPLAMATKLVTAWSADLHCWVQHVVLIWQPLLQHVATCWVLLSQI